ncbi:STAS domain-containing protein [Micromonospora cathayae]|uniref:STAS domain-containing protein n=1 Tax=Micromonospora cathayae TaxID=3028804 RepID=A0ABY7ZKX1_9ACTN|nr:hypothetical protein [Micromonospora sp. HUAS 3]WDZ83416.1 hypothetical protein PVK37_23560 [Micromonospora sp. HUAS 3]
MSTDRLRTTGRPTRLEEAIMTCSLDVEGSVTVVTVRGEVDMSTPTGSPSWSVGSTGPGPIRLVVDLARVTFLDAHGITALLRTGTAYAPRPGRSCGIPRRACSGC